MNKLIAKTDWRALCALSIRMINSHPEEEPFDDDLVYVADNSFGCREVEAADSIDLIDNGFGNWDGFPEDGAQRFLWGSASSGATIEAKCNDDAWTLVFQGCDTSERPESSYVRDFALAADLETLDVTSLDDGPAIAAVIKGGLAWLSEQGRSEDVDKLRAFAAKLQLSLEQPGQSVGRW